MAQKEQYLKLAKSINISWTLPSGTRESCTGCGVCAAACPNNCIDLLPDYEGFVYPVVDRDKCINCRLCINVCPINSGKKDLVNNDEVNLRSAPVSVFASWHLNEEIRKESSSGGVFTALAQNILERGGAVVGAAFDDQFLVRHILVENPDELHRLRGSKYVQSEIPLNIFSQIGDRLEKRIPVLFSGTPCQVAGVLKIFEKSANSLFACDLVCHGVPSPLLFKSFLEHENKVQEKLPLKSVSFRNKAKGWKKYTLQLVWEHQEKNFKQSESYMAAFLKNYSLRPCCYNCKFTNTNRPGDLTIADFWGVKEKYPEFDKENKGTSLILVNTPKGQSWLDDCRSNLFIGTADLETAVSGNLVLARPSRRPSERENFYFDLEQLTFPQIIRKYHLHAPSRTLVLARRIKRKIKTLFPGIPRLK
jgi:coenzyme F420-reducing hydrogenase beta subunit